MFVYHCPALCFQDLFLCWLYCSSIATFSITSMLWFIEIDFTHLINNIASKWHIYHFELVYTTRTNVWNQFPLFRGCGPTPSSHSVSTAIYQFHPEPNRERRNIRQHSLLVLTSLPQIALVSPQCAEFSVRSARVSSECARFYRARIIILRHFSARVIFFCLLHW